MDKSTATKPSATPKPRPTNAGKHPTDRSTVNPRNGTVSQHVPDRKSYSIFTDTVVVPKNAPQPRAADAQITHTSVPGPLAPTPTDNFVTHTLLTGSDALLTPTPVPAAPPAQ